MSTHDTDGPDAPLGKSSGLGSGVPNAGDGGPIEKARHIWQNAEDREPGDLTRRHEVRPVPVNGWVRLLLFLVGIGMLVLGLSIAFPSKTIADPYLVKAILVVSIFGGVAIYWNRESLKRQFKLVGIWALLIAGISGFYMVQSEFGGRFVSALDPSSAMVTGEGLVIHKSSDGHYWMRTEINGETIRMMVDTGASNIVLSPRDAERVGLDTAALSYTGRASTANGTVKMARARVRELRIGDAVMENVPVTVNGAAMPGSLFGLSGLEAFSSFEFRDDRLILRP